MPQAADRAVAGAPLCSGACTLYSGVLASTDTHVSSRFPSSGLYVLRFLSHVPTTPSSLTLTMGLWPESLLPGRFLSAYPVSIEPPFHSEPLGSRPHTVLGFGSPTIELSKLERGATLRLPVAATLHTLCVT